jgi:hypothetical protein
MKNGEESKNERFGPRAAVIFAAVIYLAMGGRGW